MSVRFAEPARPRGWAVAHVVITTLIAAGLPLAFAILAPSSAKVWGGVVLLGLLGYAAIRSGWAWLLPLVGAIDLLPILVDLSRWQPAYTVGSAALSCLTAALVIVMTFRGWRRPRHVTRAARSGTASRSQAPVAEEEGSASDPATIRPATIPPAMVAASVDSPTLVRSPAPSAPASSIVPDRPGPALPLTAEFVSDTPMVVCTDGSVTITWANPQQTGGAPVVDFAIEVSKDGGVTWVPVPRERSDACVATIGELELGVPHAFRVAAVNAAGRGTFSAPTAPFIPIGAPAAPHSVVCASADRAIVVRWQAPSDTGGTGITGYAIEVSGDEGATWSRVPVVIGTEPMVTVPNLANGTAHAFRVRAINAAGEGASSEMSASAVPAGPPSPPGPITATPVVGGLDLAWTPPAKDGGLPITEYRIELSTDGGATWQSSAGATRCTASLTELASTAAYLVRIAASNGVCGGPWVTLGAAVSPIGVPGAVPSVTAHFSNGPVRMLAAVPPSPSMAAPQVSVGPASASVTGQTATRPEIRVPDAPPVDVVVAGSPPAGAGGDISVTTVIPQPGRGGHAVRWALGSALIVVGLVVIVLALRATVLSDLAFEQGQSSEVGPAESGLAGDPADGSPVIAPVQDDSGEEPPGGAEPSAGASSIVEPPAPTVPLGTVVGTIAFQRSGEPLVYDGPLVVRQGVGNDELALGPGHYPRTVMPGEVGNAAIAGHRTGWGSPFLHLDDLAVGDEVLFTDAGGTVLHFSVHTTAVVKPDEVWVLGPDPVSVGSPTLTLTTCDPPHVNSKRLVVFAVLDPQA